MVEEYRNRFKKVIDPLCPSEKTSEMLMSYMYSMVVTSLARVYPDNAQLQEERASCMELSPMMGMSFEKAFREMLVFSSHNILMESIEAAFNSVKGLAEVNYRKPGMEVVPKASGVGTPTPQVFSTDDNVAEFDFDFESIPKVDPSILKRAIQTAKAGSPVQRMESNEYEPDFEMDIDAINAQVPILIQGSKKKDGDSPDQLDASLYTSETYSRVPEVSQDLDY